MFLVVTIFTGFLNKTEPYDKIVNFEQQRLLSIKNGI